MFFQKCKLLISLYKTAFIKLVNMPKIFENIIYIFKKNKLPNSSLVQLMVD